jgi:hypothetical protein
MKEFLFILLILFPISKGLAVTTNLSIHVDLWPAGDFVAVSKEIKGKVYKKDGKYFGENIMVPVKSIDTGIELRNTHLQQRLGADKNSKASIVMVKGSGENGKGEATFLINGIKQTFPISYKEISPNFIEAEFDIDFSKFKIPNLKYMGVGVQDIGKVVVTIPLEEKK